MSTAATPAPQAIDPHAGHGGEPAACPNCGHAGEGPYCAHCGQKHPHPGDLSLGHAWHHVLHELVHLDGKVLHSLRLLFTRPGQLSLDFLEGRRARHVHPIRLFLVFLVGYVLFAGVRLEPAGHQLVDSLPPRLHARVEARAAKVQLTLDQYLHQRHMTHVVPYLKGFTVGSMLLAGVWLRLFFRRQRRHLPEHMVVALHVGCVNMALGMTVGWIYLVTSSGWLNGGAIWVPSYVYEVLAAKRVYGESWPRTILKIAAVQLIGVVLGAAALNFLMFRAILAR
jgi:hypothetical protein